MRNECDQISEGSQRNNRDHKWNALIDFEFLLSDSSYLELQHDNSCSKAQNVEDSSSSILRVVGKTVW